MHCLIKVRQLACVALIGAVFFGVGAASSHAAPSFGLQWQASDFGFGPWKISDFGTAYGVAGADWYDSQMSSSIFDANAVNGAVPFSSPSMNGGSVNLAWSSSNARQGVGAQAYGWSHANETPGGVPASADEAVLAAFLFAEYDPVAQQGSKIRVRISGLDALAAANSVPLSYKVKLLASSEWDAVEYTPAVVADNASHSEIANFAILPTHPRWNGTEFSSGGMADPTTVFTGSILDVTIAGPNGYEVGTTGTFGRATLAGLTVTFVPTVVPEPGAIALLSIGGIGLAGFVLRKRRRLVVRSVVLLAALFGATTPSWAQTSFGINWQNNFFGFGPWNVSDFGPAFGVAGDDWFNSIQAHSTFDAGSDAAGVIPFSSPAMGGGAVNLKWSSDRFFGGQAAPVYGYSHANEPPGVGYTPGLPSNAEEAIFAASLVSSYNAATGLGDKIEVSITGLASIATAKSIPLAYKVKVMASDWGLPKPFYLPPEGTVNPDPGGTVDNFSPALVADNASHSQSVNFVVRPEHPRWQQLGVDQGWDPQAPYFSSGAVGESTTVFTGDTLTITLDGPFDFGGLWQDPTYGVTRLAGIAITFVNPAHPGDFDSDGDVDGADFVAWQTNFPKPTGATLAQGDADGDGDVDGADFVVWQTNFPFTPGPGSSPVPEPSAMLLMAAALIGAAGWRLKRS
jgi:hypothetical protein